MRAKLVLSLAMLLAPLAVLLPVAPAGATGSCASGYYPQATYSSGGAAVAVLCLNNEGNGPYWRLDSLGRYNGVSKTMSLTVCQLASNGGPSDQCRKDEGTYRYFAGPVSDAGYGCLWVHSVMYNGSGTKIVDKVKTICN